MKTSKIVSIVFFVFFAMAACDDEDNSANALGVGAQCTEDSECDQELGQSCLLDFKGGYCGIADCVADDECPDGSRCVTHDDGSNYCFLTCIDKIDCNTNRDAESESNCSSSITYVDEPQDGKACVPPSN